MLNKCKRNKRQTREDRKKYEPKNISYIQIASAYTYLQDPTFTHTGHQDQTVQKTTNVSNASMCVNPNFPSQMCECA